MAMKEGTTHSFSWIIYSIVLPILFFIVLMGIVLQVIFGFNVVGKVSSWFTQVPVVRHALGMPAPAVPIPSQITALHTQLAGAKQTTGKLQTEVSSLQAKLGTQGQQLNHALTTVGVLKKELKKLNNISSSAATSAAIYTNMSPNQAAQILMKQPFLTQVMVLHAMAAADQATILSSLPAATAAKLLRAGA